MDYWHKRWKSQTLRNTTHNEDTITTNRRWVLWEHMRPLMDLTCGLYYR